MTLYCNGTHLQKTSILCVPRNAVWEILTEIAFILTRGFHFHHDDDAFVCVCVCVCGCVRVCVWM
jgi:hypothetical protein